MTMTGQRIIDLVAAYDHFLEKQIVDQGSSLPCRDETLCNEVDELLKSEESSDAHCLGLDTFNIMEESLQSEVTDCRRPAKVRTGLKGLTKAFEVLEQAALNLHLGPWREEYKVVKMYSGIFTHCIKPVFSTQQIELLFGLLGYKLCSSRREQLRLQPQKVSAARVDELLRLSCAFFVARCECLLLLDALGKYAGQPRWELNIVRERQKGHSFQMALDSTMRLVDVKQPLQELPEENDMDLYTDELEGETPVDESPRSLTWMPEKSANGMSREPVYISTYLKKPSADSNANDFLPASRSVSQFYRDFTGDQRMALTANLEEKTDHETLSMLTCTCLEIKSSNLFKCKECQTYHHVHCPKLEPCTKNHTTELVDEIPEQLIPIRAAASQHRGSTSPTLTNCNDTFSSLSLHNKPDSSISFISPLALHSCCDNQDAQILCFRCQVFHNDYCNEAKICLHSHETKKLGLCSVGRCSQKAHMLCKFCGDEYCKDCWYKNPLYCRCGHTFDFSSSV